MNTSKYTLVAEGRRDSSVFITMPENSMPENSRAFAGGARVLCAVALRGALRGAERLDQLAQ